MILLDKLKMKAGMLCSYCASLFRFAKGFITIISRSNRQQSENNKNGLKRNLRIYSETINFNFLKIPFETLLPSFQGSNIDLV